MLWELFSDTIICLFSIEHSLEASISWILVSLNLCIDLDCPPSQILSGSKAPSKLFWGTTGYQQMSVDKHYRNPRERGQT